MLVIQCPKGWELLQKLNSGVCSSVESTIIVNSYSSLLHAGRGRFTFLTSRSGLVAPGRPPCWGPFDLLVFKSCMSEIFMIVTVHVFEFGQSLNGSGSF